MTEKAYEGYGVCPKCGQVMECYGDILDWTKPIIEEDYRCEECEIDVLVTSERIKGCHWCESENSVREGEQDGVKYWYCKKCHVLTDSPEEEHWYRWVKSEAIE